MGKFLIALSAFDLAREFVSDFINYIQFYPYEIQNIEKLQDGTYKLTCKVESTQSYEEFAQSSSSLGSYVGYTLYFKVKMNGDEIEFIGRYLTINGSNAKHTVVTEITFIS